MSEDNDHTSHEVEGVEELKRVLAEERQARKALEAQLLEEREERGKLEQKSKKLMIQMEEVYRRMESEGEGHVNKLVLKILGVPPGATRRRTS